MRILYLATSGSMDPTRASIPWHLAVNGSVEVGQTIAIVLAGDATELVKPAVRGGVEGIGVPPLLELFAKASDHKLLVYV